MEIDKSRTQSSWVDFVTTRAVHLRAHHEDRGYITAPSVYHCLPSCQRTYARQARPSTMQTLYEHFLSNPYGTLRCASSFNWIPSSRFIHHVSATELMSPASLLQPTVVQSPRIDQSRSSTPPATEVSQSHSPPLGSLPSTHNLHHRLVRNGKTTQAGET